MPNDSKQRPPLWINRFLLFGALVFLAAGALAVALGWSRSAQVLKRPIADIAVNLGGRTVREHCTTCHPNGVRAAKSVTAQHQGEHPDISPHAVEDLGCTACHLGEGMALDTVMSHGLPGKGARQILRGTDLQASCYTCHLLKPLSGAEKAWRGYQLFFEKACDTCHRTEPSGLGGHFGPDLSSVGSHLGLRQIQEAIRYPKKDPVNSIMPRYPLSRNHVRDISYYLKSRVTFPFHTTPMLRKLRKVDRLKEKGVFPPEADFLKAMKCLACHRFREDDGRIAPDLTFIGLQREKDYLHDILRSPASRVPGSAMPVLPLSSTEEKQLVDYLAEEAQGTPLRREVKDFYMRLCQLCHAANGDGRGSIQPNLAGFPRAFFGNGEFFRAVSDRRLLQSLEKGIPGTSMPPYGTLLHTTEGDALLDLVFQSFIGTNRTEKAPLSPLPRRPEFLAKGNSEKLFRKYCSRCHGHAGTGTGPEALRYQPRPRNLTNRPFFNSIDDQRIARAIFSGIPGTAMPPFHSRISDEGLWQLVARVRFLSGSAYETK